MESPSSLPHDGITDKPQAVSVPGKPSEEALPDSISIDQIDDEVLRFVVDALDKGSTHLEIKGVLIANEFDPKVADLVVNAVVKYRRQHGPLQVGADNPLRADAVKNMAIGGVVCVIGLIITFATIAASSGAAGGKIVLAWGAILFGAIQFFRGVAQLTSLK